MPSAQTKTCTNMQQVEATKHFSDKASPSPSLIDKICKSKYAATNTNGMLWGQCILSMLNIKYGFDGFGVNGGMNKQQQKQVMISLIISPHQDGKITQ